MGNKDFHLPDQILCSFIYSNIIMTTLNISQLLYWDHLYRQRISSTMYVITSANIVLFGNLVHRFLRYLRCYYQETIWTFDSQKSNIQFLRQKTQVIFLDSNSSINWFTAAIKYYSDSIIFVFNFGKLNTLKPSNFRLIIDIWFKIKLGL